MVDVFAGVVEVDGFEFGANSGSACADGCRSKRAMRFGRLVGALVDLFRGLRLYGCARVIGALVDGWGPSGWVWALVDG